MKELGNDDEMGMGMRSGWNESAREGGAVTANQWL